MARRINQIQLIGVAIMRLVHHAHGVRLDGDAALALEIHGVKNLRLHLAPGHRASDFEQSITQRRLSVVDVGNNREVSKEV